MFTLIIGVEVDLLIIHFPFLAVIRGCMVRKEASRMNRLKKYRENAKPRRKSRTKIPEVKVCDCEFSSSLVFSVS